MLFLSAMNLVLISGRAVVRRGFDNYIFLAFYPVMVTFALVFNSFQLILAWATARAVYSPVSVMTGPGLDLAVGDERALMVRVVVMYAIVGAIDLIVRFERNGRQAALSRAWGGVRQSSHFLLNHER